MKEQNYKQHIQGMPLDKLQEGKFDYTDVDSRSSLSEYAKKLRSELNSEVCIFTHRDDLQK